MSAKLFLALMMLLIFSVALAGWATSAVRWASRR